jgi:hypothetical protein
MNWQGTNIIDEWERRWFKTTKYCVTMQDVFSSLFGAGDIRKMFDSAEDAIAFCLNNGNDGFIEEVSGWEVEKGKK